MEPVRPQWSLRWPVCEGVWEGVYASSGVLVRCVWVGEAQWHAHVLGEKNPPKKTLTHSGQRGIISLSFTSYHCSQLGDWLLWLTNVGLTKVWRRRVVNARTSAESESWSLIVAEDVFLILGELETLAGTSYLTLKAISWRGSELLKLFTEGNLKPIEVATYGRQITFLFCTGLGLITVI